MTIQASARPVDAQGGGDELSPQVRVFPHDTGLVLQHIRKHHPAFQKLPRMAWVVFMALACFLRKKDRGYPTQATLAAQAGYSVRTVRRALRALEAAFAVRCWRVHRPDGGFALYYAYGPAAHAAFDEVAERFPRAPLVKARSVPREPPRPPSRDAGISAAPAFVHADKMSEGHADKVTDKPQRFKEEPSSSTAASPWPVGTAAEPAPSPPAEQQGDFVEVSEEDRVLARAALAEHARRSAKRSPLPRVPSHWDADLVDLVARRIAQTPGTADEKARAQNAALRSAFAKSERAPTVRFVWGSQEHYLAHVAHGAVLEADDAREKARKRVIEQGGATTPPPRPEAPSGVDTAPRAPLAPAHELPPGIDPYFAALAAPHLAHAPSAPPAPPQPVAAKPPPPKPSKPATPPRNVVSLDAFRRREVPARDDTPSSPEEEARLEARAQQDAARAARERARDIQEEAYRRAAEARELVRTWGEATENRP